MGTVETSSGAWFGHSGDMGDVIYALPTIRALGGGTLFLYHREGKTSHGMDEAKARSLHSLLIQQSYINDVVFCPSGYPPYASDHDLNGFRDHGGKGRNLADMHLATHGLESAHRDSAWISIDSPVRAKRVVFARTARVRNRHFPWKRLWEYYHDSAGFIGTTDEHADFCRTIGDIPFIATKNLLEVASVIAGSHLFVGNESCPAAIAEGLKHTMIVEVTSWMRSWVFNRPGRLNELNERVALPEIKPDRGATNDHSLE
jgi:hypothetical protein